VSRWTLAVLPVAALTPVLALALTGCGSTSEQSEQPASTPSASTTGTPGTSGASGASGTSGTSSTPAGQPGSSTTSEPGDHTHGTAAASCYSGRSAGEGAVVEPFRVRRSTTLTSAVLTGTTGLTISGPAQVMAAQTPRGFAGPVAPGRSVAHVYTWSTRAPAAGTTLSPGTWELYFPVRTETVASYTSVRVVTTQGVTVLTHGVTLTDDPKGCPQAGTGSDGPPIESP
jgi:hypothetical protein